MSKGIQATVWNGRLSFHKLPSTKHDILVLADGAHNPASAATLSAYIASTLARVSAASRNITLTYVLALSHSPPKTPLQTLSQLLPTTTPNIKLNIALLRFTPPEGMPWVKSVPPSDLASVAASLCPGANIWEAPDDQPPEGQLKKALEWAGDHQTSEDDTVLEGMVVVAGSLYLVANFYRLLQDAA